MPLPSPALPSLSAITHPTKVRWLMLQEEGRRPGWRESDDHSAKYHADEENVQNGQLQSRALGKEQQGKTLGHIYSAECALSPESL